MTGSSGSRPTGSSRDGPSELVIGSVEDLALLRLSLLIPSRRRPETRILLDRGRFVGLHIDGLEERLNRLHGDCGCGVGSLATLVAAALVVLWILVSGHVINWGLGLTALLIVGVSAVVGKSLGILLSRIRLWHLLAVLKAHVSPPDSAEGLS